MAELRSQVSKSQVAVVYGALDKDVGTTLGVPQGSVCRARTLLSPMLLARHARHARLALRRAPCSGDAPLSAFSAAALPAAAIAEVMAGWRLRGGTGLPHRRLPRIWGSMS